MTERTLGGMSEANRVEGSLSSGYLDLELVVGFAHDYD